MKKFFLMIMMTLCIVSMTSAQTVHEAKAFDNVYVTVSAGLTNPTNYWGTARYAFPDKTRPQFGVEVGKQVTTLYTTGFEFTTDINTTEAKTAFDELSLVWLHKFNLTNAIWGYKIDRKWELQTVGGLGWGHEMVYRNNYAIANLGLELAYNINDTWSLMLNPQIEWEGIEEQFNINNSNVGLTVGVSYKFRNRDGNRGFAICKYGKLQAKYDRLNEEINALRKEQLTNLATIEILKLKIDSLNNNVKVDTVIIDNTIAPTIGFAINKAELTNQSDAYLYQIAQLYKDFEIIVEGYADEETGTPKYNMELSKKRAEVVKAKLIKYGATKVSIKAYGDTVQPFADNDMNRVAIVIKK